jgi:sarcosine oxidase
MTIYDAVVIGTGAMGSATVRELARRGKRVVGIDRFSPPHDKGSTHGATRVIRLGYFEDPAYVPLLRRAYELWRELEAAGPRLLHITGIIELGPPDGQVVSGTLAASNEHGIPKTELTAKELMQRFPAFRVPSHYAGVFQKDGGFLDVNPSIEAFRAHAIADGAEFRDGVTALSIEPTSTGVRVVTDGGTIDAGAAVVTAGAWLKQLLPELPARVRVTRQVLGWFDPVNASLFSREAGFGVFMMESEHGLHYGFPLDGDGLVKIAKHHHFDEEVDPDRCDRTISSDDEAGIRSAVAEHMPGANGPLKNPVTCFYTRTPDDFFILDRIDPHIVVGSPCSGHGFKFSPVIGEILAELASDGTTRHDIGPFRLDRPLLRA